MRIANVITAEPQRIPREMQHLIFFSILFLMFVTLAPDVSWGSGNCYAKQAQLEGPLLPATV